MIKPGQSLFGLASAGICLVLAACGGGSGGDDSTGLLSLGISDGPAHNTSKVCIAFDGIELKPADGPPFDVTPGLQNINLLEFQGANAAPYIFAEPVPAGEYLWLRLKVKALRGGTGGTGNDPASPECQGNNSYMATEDGRVYNLFIPSGASSGLKLNNRIVVPVNGLGDFTADVDLMQSLVEAPGLMPDVAFKPVIRLVNNAEVGTLTGEVDALLAGDASCEAPSVYVFDDGVTPNAIDTDGSDAEDPVATAIVSVRDNGDDSSSWRYTIGFLLAGDYEAAFTCDGENFEPVDGAPAPITAGQTTTVSF